MASNEDNTERQAEMPDDSARTTAPPSRPSRNRGPRSFVVIFVVIVIASLSGYQFAIDSKANDFYLFVLAKHTAWTLGLVGQSCAVEEVKLGNENPQRVRASIAAWEAGSENPSGEDIAAAADAPVTPWERWRYKALEGRSRERQKELGPYVLFVLSPDLNMQIRSLREEIEELRANQALDPEVRDARLLSAESTLTEYQARSRALIREPLANRKSGHVFGFSLVPSCGAIEVISIFLAAVIAFPARTRNKLWGIALGLPLLYGVNVLRIAFLAIVGALDSYERVWFNFLHEYVWQAVYIIFVVAAWLAWVEFFVRRSRQ